MKRLAKVVGWALLGLLGLVAGAAGYLGIQRHRRVDLPAPRGPFAVGRLITEWTDSSRAETLGGSGGPRRLSVWIWYPAQSGSGPAGASGEPAPYLPPDWARALDARQPWPASLIFEAPASRRPHALVAAPPATGAPFPVLVFQPGLHAQVASCTTVAEELASRGYVVVGLNPTYNAPVTVLGGEVVPQSRLTSLDDGASGAGRGRAVRMLEVWAADQRFAMDRLTRLAREPGPLAGRLDLRAFGLWGWSFGGAAAWKTCRSDARCTGAANLDGALWGAVAASGMTRPVLFLGSASSARHPDPEIDSVLARSPGAVRRVLPGMRHGNFADVAVSPLARLYRLLGGVGPIDGARGLAWTADELDAFFRVVMPEGAAPEQMPRRQAP